MGVGAGGDVGAVGPSLLSLSFAFQEKKKKKQAQAQAPRYW